MKTSSEPLLREMARRNWIILLILTVASLGLRDATITSGVLGGGLIAVFSYRWLYRSLSQVLAHPSQGAARGFQINYFIRLAALAAALFLLITKAQVHPVGLLIGLSVVVINLFWTTLKQAFFRGGSSKS